MFAESRDGFRVLAFSHKDYPTFSVIHDECNVLVTSLRRCLVNRYRSDLREIGKFHGVINIVITDGLRAMPREPGHLCDNLEWHLLCKQHDKCLEE